MGDDFTPASTTAGESAVSVPVETRKPKQRVSRAAAFLSNGLVWVLMRLSLVDSRFREVVDRTYDLRERAPRHSVAESEAVFLFERSEAASEHTDDNVKQLLA